jgi:hypothetical protein
MGINVMSNNTIPIRVFGEKTAVVGNDQEIDESQFETVVRWMRADGRIYAHAVKGFAEIKYDSDGGLTVNQQKLELLNNER